MNFVTYKIVNHDEVFKIKNDHLYLIPFIKTLVKKTAINENTCFLIEPYEYNSVIINGLIDHKLINDYITHWGGNINENYLKTTKSKLFERTLIIKKMEEFDIELIYKYINSHLKDSKNITSLEKDIYIIKTIERLILTVDKMGMIGLKNKCLFVLMNYISNISYESYSDFNDLQN